MQSDRIKQRGLNSWPSEKAKTYPSLPDCQSTKVAATPRSRSRRRAKSQPKCGPRRPWSSPRANHGKDQIANPDASSRRPRGRASRPPASAPHRRQTTRTARTAGQSRSRTSARRLAAAGRSADSKLWSERSWNWNVQIISMGVIMKLLPAVLAFGIVGFGLGDAAQAACQGRVETRTVNGIARQVCLDGSFATCIRDAKGFGNTAAQAKAICDRKRAEGKVK
jgi:hypothetical protein